MYGIKAEMGGDVIDKNDFMLMQDAERHFVTVTHLKCIDAV